MTANEIMNSSQAAPSNAGWNSSQKILLAQGALAAVLYALGTGNFLAGFLQSIGAQSAQIARIASIPQLGCVLQLLAPLYFERMRHRKTSIMAMCFLFRFSLGFMVFAPLIFGTSKARIGFVCILYFFSFLLAGFVTPALNQWILQIAPSQNRGIYFSVKDILASMANAVAAFLMGLLLDRLTGSGHQMTGYYLIYGFCIAASLLDLLLMSRLKEAPNPTVEQLDLHSLLTPLRDRTYRPILTYECICYFSSMLSSGFLSTYQLTYFGMSHTFITSVGVACALISMSASWLWGRLADKTYWTHVIILTRALNTACCFGWCFLPKAFAFCGGPAIMALSSVANGAASMAGVNLQFDHCPAQGKTIYLGVTAAVASTIGYCAALAGSGLQELLERNSAENSMGVLFGISGILMCGALLYGKKRLPHTEKAME